MKPLGLLALALLGLGCLPAPKVVRVMGGETSVGRFIDDRAYAAYLDGALAEQQRDWDAAALAYEQAHELDPEGLDPLVRLGAVQCQRAPYSHDADRLLAQVLKRDHDYVPAYVESARCALRRGDNQRAVGEAREAMGREPRNREATEVLSAALRLAGDLQAADRVLFAFDLLEPRVPSIRAPRAELSASAIAVRAAALGDWATARERAEWVLRADPDDADAHAVMLSLPEPVFVPAPSSWVRVRGLACWVLADALLRRSEAQAARSVLQACDASVQDGDPVAQWLRARVLKAIGP